MKKRIFLYLLLLFAVCNLPALELEIQVLDRDLDIPLEGVLLVDTYTGIKTYSNTDGNALIEIDDDRNQVILIAELIGYEDSKTRITSFGKKTIIQMVMEGVLEGQELVVEEEAIGESDEELGVSIAMDEDVIQSAAKIGIFEDALTALKILPGVIPTDAFLNFFSVRGGDPSGMAVLMDGVHINYPYHWGGLVSIFNPNIVESMKFSPGVFSAKYGQATSGILEVTTVNPNEGFRFENISSTTSFEVFLQTPLGKKKDAGFFIGTKLTNLDLAFKMVEWYAEAVDDEVLLEMTDTISTVPYIRDFYMKTFYNPGNNLKWYLNAFYGNDGIGVQTDNSDADTSEQIISDTDFNYYNSDIILNSGVKILPTENLLIEVIAGYEYFENRISLYEREYGTKDYSDEFITLYVPGDTSFTIDAVSDYEAETVKQTINAKLNFDLAIGENHLLQWGLGCAAEYNDFFGGGELWMLTYDTGTPQYQQFAYEPTQSAAWIIDSSAYVNMDSSFFSKVLNIDLGCRVDHSYYSADDGFSVNTMPTVSPRLNVVFAPEKGAGIFKKNTFSAGFGLFAKNPFSDNPLSEEMSIEDFEIAIPKTMMGILGWNTQLPAGLNFKLEGYYKYFYDRFYFNLIDTGSGSEFVTHNDGYGHSAGFDLVLRRKLSRHFFGMLSYTFNYTRMRYPEADGLDPDVTERDMWIYPYYHRFHTLNLFLDIKPTNMLTITTKLAFTTGTPRDETGDMQMFPAVIINDDGSTTFAEMYMQPSFYSDLLRTNINIKLDLKVALNNYFKKSKLSWECYLAIENILSPLMTVWFPPPDSYQDKWGNVTNGSGGVQNGPSMNMPTPSIGFKISY